MSLFKNFFGQKNRQKSNLSILEANESETLTRESGKLVPNSKRDVEILPTNSREGFPSDFQKSVLDEDELAFVLAMEVANQRWERLGLDRNAGIRYLHKFISGYIPQVEDLEEDIVNLFYEFQIIFMVKKPVNDFYRLQEFSPFSTTAMTVFLDLLRAHKSGGERQFLRRFNEIFPLNQQFTRPEEPIRFIEEHSGLSIEEAIVVKVIGPNSGLSKLPRARIGVNAEYHYLSFNYGFAKKGWDLQMQKSLIPIDGKELDCLRISFPDGRERDFFFDITDFRRDYSFVRE